MPTTVYLCGNLVLAVCHCLVSGSGSVKKTYGGATPSPFTFQKVTSLSLLL
jgi:hypothetical protein